MYTWIVMLVLRMLCNNMLLVNHTWHSLLTAADVRCAVASTRKKKVNWMMSCMVSERSHCSSEVQHSKSLSWQYQHKHTLKYSYQFYWESGSVAYFRISVQWEWSKVFRCTCFSRQGASGQLLRVGLFYTHSSSCWYILPISTDLVSFQCPCIDSYFGLSTAHQLFR